MLSNQHYSHRANQKLRSWANAVFQNRGVCGQAVPSFPSPSPVIHVFLLLSQLSRRTSRGNVCYAGYKRQKLIQIADRSKDCWLVVQEYESDDLASNSEDEKHFKKAKNAAEKKRKNPKRSKLVSSKSFKSDDDKQLFRGNIFLLSALLCYFSRGWNA